MTYAYYEVLPGRMDALGAPDWELMITMDMNTPMSVAVTPHGSESSEINLAMLDPEPEHVRKIQKESVKSAILSVAALRQGRGRDDSLTLGGFTDFTSAPSPGVRPEG